ncbi:MAG: Lrp/AsnC family transcriptional regulator [Opitutaceae bacterium]|nr:Lrp/AsnC family transcriptional regulator [Opitutaceae bacterium]
MKAGRWRAEVRYPALLKGLRDLRLDLLAGMRIFSAIMNEVFKLLAEGERLNESQMAEILGLSEKDVDAQLAALQEEGLLLGWIPVLNPSTGSDNIVRGVIEVKVTPERGGGFNRLAQRIARFDEVESCYLMSGAYDLLVVVKQSSLHKVASFVSERLSTIEGIVSTATHFMLRAYKEQGYLIEQVEEEKDRLDVTP